jgi:hypothetical protein
VVLKFDWISNILYMPRPLPRLCFDLGSSTLYVNYRVLNGFGFTSHISQDLKQAVMGTSKTQSKCPHRIYVLIRFEYAFINAGFFLIGNQDTDWHQTGTK